MKNTVHQSKICAFMTQKGGAGKSVLTNIVCNEIILWHLLNTGDRVNALVIDIDPQHTNTDKRQQDIQHLKFTEDSPVFQALPVETKTEIGRLQRRYALLLDAGYNAYKLGRVDLDNELQIDTALQQIQSNFYDYIFIDFPGTLTQSGTGVFFQLLQHIFIPLTVNPSDLLGTECFLQSLETLDCAFQSRHLIWNKYEVSRQRKTEVLEQKLIAKYNIPFMENRIPYAPLTDCNTLIPASLNVNLNLDTYSVVKPYLQNLADEIINITGYNE